MAYQTPNFGLYVWDQSSDPYSHTQLAANWATIDSALGSPATSMEVLSAVPVSGNFAGRLVMLSVANGGWQPWTLIRFDGSAWRAVGYEVQPAIPSSGNFAGRIVVLSSSTGGFPAWSTIIYNGSSWNSIGAGWTGVATGSGSLNIQGVQQPGDVFVNNASFGIVLTDRTDGSYRRVFLQSGQLNTEVVS